MKMWNQSKFKTTNLVIAIWIITFAIFHGSVQAQQTCESALVALKKASLELEGRLKKCRQEEKIRCDVKLNGTLADFEKEKEVSARLRELLKAKDLERKMSEREIEDRYKMEITLLEEDLDTAKFELKQSKETKETVQILEEDLRAEKKKTNALADSLEACRDQVDRQTKDEIAQLKAQIEKQKDIIESNKETLEARDAEVESLRRIVTHLEEQKKAGILEWFKNPKSLESLLDAKNTTLNLIFPGLDATERRLLELKAKSSEKIESVIGMDSETSALMSGLLAWGILLIPFFMSFCLLVRVRLSLSKMVLWASLYAALFCLVLFGFSFALGDEALMSLRKLSPLSHDVVLIILMLGNVLLIVSIALLTLKQWLVTDLGSLRVRHMFQAGIPMVVAVHYYYHYYFIALSSAANDFQSNEGQQQAKNDPNFDDDFDERYWLIYAIAYFSECVLLVLGNYGSNHATTSPGVPPAKPSPAVVKVANVVNNIVDAVEGSNPKDNSSHTDEDVEASGKSSSYDKELATHGEGKKKKKKKSKMDMGSDGSSLEVLGPSDLLDAVVNATSGSKKLSEKGD